MPKFAVYYIPPAENELYQLASRILGYDVRARTTADMPPELHERFGGFDTAWVALAQPFGFHLTITDALDCQWSTLPLVERELANLLACFDSSHPFILTRREDIPVGVWGSSKQRTLVLLYEPNKYLGMLHALLVARINPLGIGTDYLRRYLAHPAEAHSHRGQQIRLFHSPTILDNWYPHFTLLNPYTGGEIDTVTSLLTHLFEPYTQITMHSICLLTQMDGESNWHIYREFQLPVLPL